MRGRLAKGRYFNAHIPTIRSARSAMVNEGAGQRPSPPSFLEQLHRDVGMAEQPHDVPSTSAPPREM